MLEIYDMAVQHKERTVSAEIDPLVIGESSDQCLKIKYLKN